MTLKNKDGFMSIQLWKFIQNFYFPHIFRLCIPWIGLVLATLLMSYSLRTGSENIFWVWLLESELALFGFYLAWNVRKISSREIMEYSYLLPLPRKAVEISPYFAGSLFIILMAVFVYIIEVTGAMHPVYMGIVNIFGSDSVLLEYHPLGLQPRLNLLGIPLCLFWSLALIVQCFWRKIIVTDSNIGGKGIWIVLLISGLILFSLPSIHIGAQENQQDLPDIWLHNIPGLVGLVITFFIVYLVKKNLEKDGLESFPVQEEKWDY